MSDSVNSTEASSQVSQALLAAATSPSLRSSRAATDVPSELNLPPEIRPVQQMPSPRSLGSSVPMVLTRSSVVIVDTLSSVPDAAPATQTDVQSLDSSLRMSDKRGVYIFHGEELLSVMKQPKGLQFYPVINDCLEFFKCRGLLQLKSTDFLSADVPLNAAVFLVWTKQAILDEFLTSLNPRLHQDSPRLLIYCGEGNARKELQADFDLLSRREHEQAEKYCNMFAVHKFGTACEIMQFLQQVINSITMAEFNIYPERYSCISEVLAIKNSESVMIVNTLRSSLCVQGYPIEHCYMKTNPDIVKAAQMFQTLRAQQTLKNEDKERFYENNADGRVLIISNEKFNNPPHLRISARIDVENLVFLFQTVLGFPKPLVERNKTAAEMARLVENFSNGEHKSFAIIVILTHGDSVELFGSDGKPVHTKSLIDTFGNSASLARKPKLFIVNACRNEANANASACAAQETSDTKRCMADEFGGWYLASDQAENKDNSPNRAGLIVAYSASPGEFSYRLRISGSRFIGSLCWVYCMRAHTMDVVSMIEEVNHVMTHINAKPQPGAVVKKLVEKQLPAWMVQTTKKFYLTARTAQPGNQVADEDAERQ